MKNTINILLILAAFGASAQKLKSSESYIRFYSDAPMEDIEAVNENATSIIDMENKTLVFVVPITSFEFDKSLMQEHFNENYLESDKYPKAIFKGKIESWNGEEGENDAIAKGEFEIHGEKQQVEVSGKIIKNGDQLKVSAVFVIRLEDYKIKIPKAVFYNIAEEVEVTIKFDYQPYEKG